ncbi:MAG: amidohydrolase family protein [Pyramidobacter sp.]|uniref:amidohydrolase family protein n=1 Tax=Pyramidobacter sp. TaxID=1943581 RepID=UPI002A838FD9|nr:amidohydrolase family protein [Pyramidobacter sp.]MDY4032076.1 amidohydrolase family protein [Pyramidobacter sp.]
MKIIKADRIIVGDGKTVIENGSVAIDADRIIGVGEIEKLKKQFPNAYVEMKDGCTILPGLIDMHVHISGLYRRPEKAEMQENPAFLMLMVYKHLQDALSVGITTLRGVGEAKGIGAAIRGGYQKKYIKGPRYITCERSLTRTGGHGSTGEVAKIEVDGPWALRHWVRQNIKDGADWIKVMDSHRGSCSEFTLEELCAVTDEAHRLGYKCAIHAGNEQSTEFAVKAGFDSIEHGSALNEELAAMAIEKGLAWVPTIFVYENSVTYMRQVTKNPTKTDLKSFEFLDHTVEGYEKNFLRNYKNGMLIATGTDICFPEMFITPLQDEIKTFVRYGLTNLQAIQCATENGAKILGMADEIGLIKDGYCADLLIVKGNPVENIDSLKAVKEVYRAGERMVCNACGI